MTQEEFISLIKQPEKVSAQLIPDLKEIVEHYPFFIPARLFLTKALQLSNSIYFDSSLKLTTLYAPSRRWLYYYIHPEKMVSAEPYKHSRNSNVSGNYFDMMNVVEREGGSSKESLKSLAERLKSARALVTGNVNESAKVDKSKDGKEIKEIKEVKEIEEVEVIKGDDKVREKSENIAGKQPTEVKEIKCAPGTNAISEDYFSALEHEITEENAKKLIFERKYKQAIVILKQLNLNNPKKSVYFADQIRFLEKVIENLKK